MVTKKDSEISLNGGYSTPGHKWQRAVFFLLLLIVDIFWFHQSIPAITVDFRA